MATKPTETPEDDQKAKFREALERKNKGANHPTGGKHGEANAHGEHSREGGKREFRRKSGG